MAAIRQARSEVQDIEDTIRASITDFANKKKEAFLSQLTQQLKDLSAKLDEQQSHGLQSIAATEVIEHVTNRVVENVTKKGLSYVNSDIVRIKIIHLSS